MTVIGGVLVLGRRDYLSSPNGRVIIEFTTITNYSIYIIHIIHIMMKTAEIMMITMITIRAYHCASVSQCR